MFKSQKEIDELNARCNELARKLRDCDKKVQQRDIVIGSLEENNLF